MFFGPFSLLFFGNFISFASGKNISLKGKIFLMKHPILNYRIIRS